MTTAKRMEGEFVRRLREVSWHTWEGGGGPS